jgi:hypothetical protein
LKISASSLMYWVTAGPVGISVATGTTRAIRQEGSATASTIRALARPSTITLMFPEASWRC